MKFIPVETKSEEIVLALVDDEDHDRLSKYHWFLARGYAAASVDGVNIRMHRDVIGIPQLALEVDHINGNKLDNRKQNLRVVTHQQNMMNRKIHKNNTSGYKGVCWDIVNKKYHVTLRFRGKKIFLGRYTDLKEAALAYDKGANKYFGKFAKTNFS